MKVHARAKNFIFLAWHQSGINYVSQNYRH